MGCGVTFVCRMSGFELVAFVTSDRYTSQAWWLSSELGLCVPSLVPYHTAASRPAEPATDHGMMFVTDGGLLISVGHPLDLRVRDRPVVRVRGVPGEDGHPDGVRAAQADRLLVHLAGVVDRDLGVAAFRPGVLGVGLSGVGDRRVVDGVVGTAPVLGERRHSATHHGRVTSQSRAGGPAPSPRGPGGRAGRQRTLTHSLTWGNACLRAFSRAAYRLLRSSHSSGKNRLSNVDWR